MKFPDAVSPLQKLEGPLLDEKEVSLYIKRDDLIHPEVQGNKWRKLKYNLADAEKLGHKTLLTFGGYYSNHIYATAAAANKFGFSCIGVIRGERPEALSSTLLFAIEKGMQLHFVNRSEYKQKDTDPFIESLHQQFGDFYLIPEGGTNNFALKGVAEIMDELPTDFDFICSAAGTGGTLAGLVAGLKGKAQAIGFSSLRGDDTLTGRVNELVKEYSGKSFQNYAVNFDYHFGGYAKATPELIQFIKVFRQQFDIPLDPVYTGKMFFGSFDLIQQGYFPKGSKIIALHTGGLQGWSGFNELEINPAG